MRIATGWTGRVPTGALAAALLAGVLAAAPAPGGHAAESPVAALRGKMAAREAPDAGEDPLGRNTPFGTVLGFVNAVEHQDLFRAVEYLDTPLPPNKARRVAQQLAEILNAAELSDLSRKPEGDPEQDLPPGRQRVGVVKLRSGGADIVLERMARGTGAPVWLFSADTLKRVPQMHSEVAVNWVERHLSGTLLDARLLGYPLWRWLGVIFAVPASFVIARFVAGLLGPVIAALLGRLLRKDPGTAADRLRWPVRLLVMAVVFYALSFAALSAVSRLFWGYVAATVATIAATWAFLRLIDEAGGLFGGRREASLGSARIATERLVNRLAKGAVVLLGGIVILYIAGVNLTAVLTGVGIGGIAVALAAQKSLENLFGVVTIISDEAIRVGDLCRAGEFTGVVEDIGLRSTRIRTQGRTVVSVPNGQLVAMSLENFSMRDKTLFDHRIHVGCETSAAQLRAVTGAIRESLAHHHRVAPDTGRVSVTGFRDGSIEVEVFAYTVETTDPAFLAVQEELILRIMEIVEGNGVKFAPPPMRR